MLDAQTRAELAAALAEAERSKVAIDPLTAGNPDIDVVDAYEIQLINIRQRVADGAKVVGHKVGLSSEAMQKMMNVDEPDYGHLLDEMEVYQDVPVEAGRFLYPRVEVEVAFRADGLHLSVRNDPAAAGRRPIPAAGHGGHGLIGMRERVALFGGELQLARPRDGGHQLRARLPVAAEAVV